MASFLNCVCVCVCICGGFIIQSCLTLCSPMDCSPPGSSVHGILQARILKWVAMPSSRGSSPPRDRTQASRISGGFLTIWATRDMTFSPKTHPMEGCLEKLSQLTQHPWLFWSLCPGQLLPPGGGWPSASVLPLPSPACASQPRGAGGVSDPHPASRRDQASWALCAGAPCRPTGV